MGTNHKYRDGIRITECQGPGPVLSQPFSLEGQAVFPLCCPFPCKNGIFLFVPKNTVEDEKSMNLFCVKKIAVCMPVVQKSLMVNFKYGWG